MSSSSSGQPGAVTSGGMSKSSTLDTVIEGKKMREIDTLKRIIKFSAAVQSRMPSLDDDALVSKVSANFVEQLSHVFHDEQFFDRT